MAEMFLFLGLTPYAWLTIILIVAMFCILLCTQIPAGMVFMGSMAVLLITGVLPVEKALAGFSSESVVIVGVLFVVVTGLVHTGVIRWIVRYLLGTPKSYTAAITRLMIPVAALSSVLSNTTVVALFLNVVKIWAKRLGIKPSHLLIPLSYASGMGGVCTLIGTPPNLIISGFYTQSTGNNLSIFTTTIPGLFCLAVGILSVIALRKLLPSRKSPESTFEAYSEYTVEFMVPTTCPVVGQTIAESKLNMVRGGKLIEICRFDKEVISPVSMDEFILGGDRLIFAGQVGELLELREKYGFVSATHHVFNISELNEERKMTTAYLTFPSHLIGKRMMDCNFEEKNQVTLVAVSRQGERINVTPHEIVLRAGDSLLLEGKGLRQEDFKGDLHFYKSENIHEIGKKTLVSSGIMIAMILLSAFNILSLLQSCFLAALAMVITRCCTVDQARKSIDWDVLMIFAGSICLGNAIETTGIAHALTNGLLSVCGTNPLVVLSTICLIGTFITEFISNTAAAAIFFPIAYKSAIMLGANPLTFCVALMIAVSSSFATPIGSPTHMMVYGPGGYRFSDFIKIGVPMNIIILIANIFITTLVFPL